MTAPTIRLATSEDLRLITSQTLDLIKRLPFLYIAAAEPGYMRTWGVAGENTVADTERLYPGSFIAPHYAGETASHGDLLYNRAEPAASFMPSTSGRRAESADSGKDQVARSGAVWPAVQRLQSTRAAASIFGPVFREDWLASGRCAPATSAL